MPGMLFLGTPGNAPLLGIDCDVETTFKNPEVRDADDLDK